MWYFQNFPNTDYTMLGGQVVNIMDISKRFKFVEDVLKNRYILFNYVIKEGERPDIVAEKYYENSQLDWLLMMVNKVIDPYFDWPMSNRELETFIKKKYGSLEYAKTTDKKYFKVIQTKSRTYEGFYVPEQVLEVDLTAYTNLGEYERKKMTIYQYEIEKNNAKKSIKLLDKIHIPQVLREVETIYGRV